MTDYEIKKIQILRKLEEKNKKQRFDIIKSKMPQINDEQIINYLRHYDDSAPKDINYNINCKNCKNCKLCINCVNCVNCISCFNLLNEHDKC